jgi:hypothetical protein
VSVFAFLSRALFRPFFVYPHHRFRRSRKALEYWPHPPLWCAYHKRQRHLRPDVFVPRARYLTQRPRATPVVSSSFISFESATRPRMSLDLLLQVVWFISPRACPYSFYMFSALCFPFVSSAPLCLSFSLLIPSTYLLTSSFSIPSVRSFYYLVYSRRDYHLFTGVTKKKAFIGFRLDHRTNARESSEARVAR